MGHITGSLEEQGALIDVTVGVSKAFREAMKKVDLDVQPSRATKALIDGGAEAQEFLNKLDRENDKTAGQTDS